MLIKTNKNSDKHHSGLSISKNNNKQSFLPLQSGLMLQNSLGNLECQKLYSSPAVQTKLKVNKSGDKYEKEADSIAEQIVNSDINYKNVISLNPGGIQRKCSSCSSGGRTCAGCEEDEIHRKELSQGNIETNQEFNPPQGGSRLSSSERSYFEPRMGYDFNNVRVHTGSKANESAKRINAKAYTFGNNIVFGSGEYQPGTREGKNLLAHELTHVVQQNSFHLNGFSNLQRKCDESAVKTRMKPVFFPMHKHIIEIFEGNRILKKNSKSSSTGLVQQALVDLGFDLGKTGRNKDGVDNSYGDTMVEKVGDFQEHNAGIPRTGKLDSLTIRCLDDTRMVLKDPGKSSGTVKVADFEIRGEDISGDGEIYFSFDGSTLDKQDDEKEIKRIAKDFKCKQITLRGIMSEDELADKPRSLADKRIQVVDKRLKHHGHAKGCKSPPPSPARKHISVPEVGRGKVDFSEHRKVEIPEAQSQPTTGRVAAACNSTEDSKITPAHTDSVNMLKKAVEELNKKTPEAKSAVSLFFGSDKKLRTVRKKLTRWKNYVDNKFLSKHLCSDESDSGCIDTSAYFDPVKKKIVLCQSFIEESKTEFTHTITHESGHASIGTDDIGYDDQRLQRFLPKAPKLALKNTDSFMMLIFCLNDATKCKLPDVKDKITFPSADPRIEEALEAVAWLEKWADESWQIANWLADEAVHARDTGDFKEWRDPLPGLMDRVSKEMGFARSKKALPNTREVIFISGLHEKFGEIRDLVNRENFELVDKPGLVKSDIDWKHKPNKQDVINFGPDFFTHTRREQVKILYAELVKVAGISSSLIPAYVTLAEHFVTKIAEINEP